MKALILICLMLLGTIPALFSQEGDSNALRNYKDFLDTFQKELAEDEEPAEPVGSNYLITNPEPFPDFLTCIPAGNDAGIYAIGISDPFMSRRAGRELAWLRAKSFTAVMKTSVVKHISDYFVNETNLGHEGDVTGKYIDFYMITAALIYDSSDFQILYDTVNRYGESILMVKYTPGTNGGQDTLITISECWSSETRDNSKYELAHRIELKCENKTPGKRIPENYRFISFKKQKSYEVNSLFNGKEIEASLYRLRYKNSVPEIPEASHESYPALGLWNSMIEGFFKHVFIEAKMQAGKIKTTGDQHTSVTKILDREVIRCKQYPRLEKINILENRMYVNVQFINE